MTSMSYLRKDKNMTTVKRFYESYWKRRIKNHGAGLSGVALARAKFCSALLANEKSLGKVLDVGCGDGTLLSYLMQDFKIDPHGLDISKLAVRIAQSRGIKALVADATKRFPFPDKCFSVIICSDVLEHLIFPEKTLQEILRVGVDEAIFIFSIPNTGYFLNRLKFLLGKPIFEQGRYSSDEHLHFWTKSSFEGLLQAHGFSIVQLIGRSSKIGNLIRKESLLADTLFVKAKKSVRS